MVDRTLTLTDHLDHEWRDETVGFEAPLAGSAHEAVRDEAGAHHAVQRDADGRAVCRVDALPARGTRRFELVGVDEPAPGPAAAPAWRREEGAVVLDNGLVAVRVPAPAEGAFPAPIQGVRRGEGDWIGAGRFSVCPDLEPLRLESACREEGPLYLTWRLRYVCHDGSDYTLDLRLDAGRPWVAVTEASALAHDAAWRFDVAGADRFWTHPKQLHRNKPARVTAIEDARAAGRSDLGDVQLPVFGGIWVADDYAYGAYIAGDTAVAAIGVDGGYWDYPYANALRFAIDEAEPALRASAKAGHRRWLLMAVAPAALERADPFYASPPHAALKRYETPLDEVKEWVLDWPAVEASDRPFLLADREQLAHAQRLAREYGPLRDYVASLHRDLPGDITYYHSGTHRVFDREHRNDPAVCYVTAEDAEERRKQARFLAEVVRDGVRDRLAAMLEHVGHTDSQVSPINLGRGLRPWAALFDFAAAEGAFTADEEKLVRAGMAFFGYKIFDSHYWPAEQLVSRDDHPLSAHRTHWFPGRHHDWALYAIDNMPQNFHADLWTAGGCVAMALPNHPEARRWTSRTLDFWEAELDWWVFPEGAWVESTTYTLGAMKDYLIYCRALANAGIRDYFTDERLQRVFRFLAEILLPHDEQIGFSSLPVLGDAQYPTPFGYVFGWMAGLAKHDDAFARVVSAAWKRTGEYLVEPGRFGLNFCDFLFLDPSIPAGEAPTPGSKWYRGLGPLLRHRPGEEDEIYLFFKSGVIYSHFHEPEGTFQLWWHGVPLCDEYGVQYGEGTNEPAQHNCVEILEGSPNVYNKGDLSVFTPTADFDHTVIEAPILRAYLREGEDIWGFGGEMGPAGWHRRHVLFVKPHFVMLYDELTCAHPTAYHLNVKADAVAQDGPRLDYKGRRGVDLTFLAIGLGEREIEHSEFDVAPNRHKQFQAPAGFYHQRQLHIRSGPQEDYATLLLPHAPGAAVEAREDPTTGGAAMAVDGRARHAVLFPARRRVDGETLRYEGRAGALVAEEGAWALHQAEGTHIERPGGLAVAGDGPFTAREHGDGTATIAASGVARWLTVRGVSPARVRVDGAESAFAARADGVRFYVPAGAHEIRLEGA